MYYKQVIIARKDLALSPGKLSAQISHGSMAFMSWMIRNNAQKVLKGCKKYPAYGVDGQAQLYKRNDLHTWAEETRARGEKYFYARPKDPNRPCGELELCEPDYEYEANFTVDKDLFEQWINGAFTKCVLQAKNKNQLLKAKTLAEEMGMVEGVDFFLIRDNCLTELTPEDEDGRTLTCIGFRPMDAETIDKIGKKFHLYVG